MRTSIGFDFGHGSSPVHHIEAAKKVMGRIDLDPASSVEAQRNVKAAGFRTPEDNGLSCGWRGRIWLNPLSYS